jgi:hypothetical protein
MYLLKGALRRAQSNQPEYKGSGAIPDKWMFVLAK